MGDSLIFPFFLPFSVCGPQNITYKVQYVMALLSFVGGLTFFNSRALNHDASIATWMTCLMFSFAASRLYLAAAKQQAMMHLFQPHQAQMEGLVSIVERDGKFAALELSYFHVANNHLGGGIWYGIGFAQVARLVLVVHVTNDSIFKIMVFPLFVWALLYFLVPAVSLSPKCFPPRSPRHAFILKIFIIACSMTLAAAMYSSTEIDGLSIINTSKDHINMQIAATTQFVYALVLCLSPRVFPVYLAEILSMACMVGFWASMLEVLEARIL